MHLTMISPYVPEHVKLRLGLQGSSSRGDPEGDLKAGIQGNFQGEVR